MAVCPKCKKVIGILYRRESGVELSKFFIDGDVVDYNDEEFLSDGTRLYFECPKCWEILFEDVDEAVDFLSNKDELQELVAEKIENINKKKIKDGN